MKSALSSDPTQSSAAAELRCRILEHARSEPSPTRSELLLRRALTLFVSALIAIALFAVRGGVRTGPRPTALMLETAGGAAAIALLALAVTFGRGGSMLGRSRIWLLSVALLTPLTLLAWKLSVSASYSGMMLEWVERPGVRCLELSSLLSGLPLIGALFVLRHSDPVHPGLFGIAIGAAIGGCSWVLVDLWCPVAYVPHLLLGHVLPLLFALGIGGLVGRRVLAPQRARAPRQRSPHG